jgi:hypothetical protein
VVFGSSLDGELILGPVTKFEHTTTKLAAGSADRSKPVARSGHTSPVTVTTRWVR